MYNMSKLATHIYDPRYILQVNATFNCEVIHTSMPRKMVGNRDVRSCIMPRLPTHIVQELNGGTVGQEKHQIVYRRSRYPSICYVIAHLSKY